MMLRQKPVIVSVAAVLAVLGSARAALAGECVADEDCGHGFECEVQAGGIGGTGSGGGASGGAAGGSSGGTQGFAPPREATCGDGLCQVTESADTCAADCLNTICALSVCESNDDCAEGYECADEPVAGTGGAAGAMCGDGLCTSGETRETCAEDCTATRRCTPAGGICSSDEQCPSGFYCSFLGSGSGGFGGTGSAVGGTAGTSSGGTTGGTGAGSDAALAAGTCMPRDDGTGGTSGGGTSGGGTSGTGGSAISGSGAVGTGGVGTGGTGTGAISGTAGMEGGTSGAEGGTSGSTGGSRSSGGDGAGGTENGSGGTGTGTGSGGNASGEDPGAAERGGCAVASAGGRSAFAELGALLLAGLVALRRRRGL